MYQTTIDIFTRNACLLFAFLVLRETTPETPRLGDFVIFFWAEGLIAVSLVLVVTTWLVRRYTTRKHPLTQEEPELVKAGHL